MIITRFTFSILLFNFLILINICSAAANTTSINTQTIENQAVTVCIDPGHSGTDTPNINNTSESKINWQVALKVKKLLENDGINVVLTKTHIEDAITNTKRAEIANNANANLFLRIHCDYSKNSSCSGFAVYYPAQQGIYHGEKGPSCDVLQASKIAAQQISTSMSTNFKALKFNGIKTDNETAIGHKQGGALTGSIFSKVPVSLIEMGFLSNKIDVQFLKSESGQTQIAKSLELAVLSYIAIIPPKSGT